MSSNKNISTPTKQIEDSTEKVEKQNLNNDESSEILYSIKSVSTLNNSIVVDFNVDITKNDIKFYKSKDSSNPQYIFDINGYFKNANPTKLSINGIKNITLGQNKPDVLRIVVSDSKNLDFSYKMSKRQLILNINNLNMVKNEPTLENKKVEESINNTKEENKNSDLNNIDLENSIKSIASVDDKIIIQFNKDYTKNNIKFKTLKQNGNFESVFDISGKYKHIGPTKLEIDGIDKIITTDNNNNSIKIRLINKTNTKVNYTLDKRELIISIENKQTSIPTKVINKTIVIDAGHGADDVGAVGPNKRYEKVVNLNVAKYLYSILKQRGYKVYLTRNNDTFIKVNERTVLANEKNADIFISIHTNAVPREKANSTTGVETFFLSPARSERAKRVAALENKSDIREMNESTKDTFLESLNRPRITASHKLAIDVQAGILQSARSKYKDVSDSGVREGPFWVLVGAQMPSILVELGYISHPEESRRLYEKEYQQLLANGIANGVDSYFSKNP